MPQPERDRRAGARAGLRRSGAKRLVKPLPPAAAGGGVVRGWKRIERMSEKALRRQAEHSSYLLSLMRHIHFIRYRVVLPRRCGLTHQSTGKDAPWQVPLGALIILDKIMSVTGHD